MKRLAVCLLIIAVTGSSCLAEQPVTHPAPIQPVLEKSTTDTMQIDYSAGKPNDYSQQENQQGSQNTTPPTENPYLKPPVNDSIVSYTGGGGGSDWNPNNYYVTVPTTLIWQGNIHLEVR